MTRLSSSSARDRGHDVGPIRAGLARYLPSAVVGDYDRPELLGYLGGASLIPLHDRDLVARPMGRARVIPHLAAANDR